MTIPNIAAAMILGASATAGDLVEFESDADGWLGAASHPEAYAFDEFVPGILFGQGCLLPEPYDPLVLDLDNGTVTVSAVDGDANPACSLFDGTGPGNQVSDGFMVGLPGSPIVLRLTFDPPITAFYAFAGSASVGSTVTMRLYDPSDVYMMDIVGPVSEHEVDSIGRGFTNSSSVGAIEFTTTEDSGNGITLLGAFRSLALGEPSLGTVLIPGYQGSDGLPIVQLDFAVSFDHDPCYYADFDADGSIGFDDLLVLLALWGPCDDCSADLDGNGNVGFADLLSILASWGPCPG